ncbi:MAG: HAD-IA family hydrolase [Deltaproteobacteria bacterium]|nr:HAD-IA family hydrolase [Deltaproteobacteria bacterium]
MNHIQAIVFDFDGTLIDASEAIIESFFAVLRAHGFAEPEQPWIRSRIGKPLVGIFAEIDTAASPEQLQAYVEEYRTYFFPLSAAKTRPLPGVVDALRSLSARCKFGIATSRKGDGALHILKSLGLDNHFPVIVGIEDVAHPKPDAEPVLSVLRQLAVAPSRAMMVGDTADDVAAGKNAGTVSVGVTTGAFGADELKRAGADHVLSGLDQLVSLMSP